MKAFLILITFIIHLPETYPQVNLEWARRYNGPFNAQDGASALTVDGYGNVYVTGASQGIGTGADYCTIKYNNSGDSLWVQRYHVANYDSGTDIAVDSLGNIYVCGAPVLIKYTGNGTLVWTVPSYASRIALDSGFIYTAGTYNDDYLTRKFSSNGSLIWSRTYNGPFSNLDRITDMVLDPFGNVIVTGYSWGVGGTYYDYCTIKYSPQGDSLWVRRYNGPGPSGSSTDWAYALDADNVGNIYVTGWSIAENNRFNTATVKYNSSGDMLWVRRYPDNGSSTGHDVAVDDFGNIIVLTVEAGYYVILKYGPTGNLIHTSLPIWGHAFASAAINKIELDTQGNTYLAGVRYVSQYRSDILVAKLDSNLSQIWSFQYNTGYPTGDINNPNDIETGASGNIYVAGEVPAPGSTSDYITIKLSQPLGLIQKQEEIPTTILLNQNYPNPFNNETIIEFRFPLSGLVTISIYDAQGMEIEELVNQRLQEGSYFVKWNAEKYSSGIYFCVFRFADKTQSIKMLLIK